MNKIDTNQLRLFYEDVKKDNGKAVKAKKIVGEWNFGVGAQFVSKLEHASGTTVVEADGPVFMGGFGIKPDPVQYCLFGLAACFAQTFAVIATEKNVELKKLKITAENKVNLLKPMGLGDAPTIENVTLTVAPPASYRSKLKGNTEACILAPPRRLMPHKADKAGY